MLRKSNNFFGAATGDQMLRVSFTCPVVRRQLVLLGLRDPIDDRYNRPCASVTTAAVKDAFRDRCKVLHPDCGGSEQDFRDVNQAYQALMEAHNKKPTTTTTATSSENQTPSHSTVHTATPGKSAPSQAESAYTSKFSSQFSPPSWEANGEKWRRQSEAETARHQSRSSGGSSNTVVTSQSSSGGMFLLGAMVALFAVFTKLQSTKLQSTVREPHRDPASGGPRRERQVSDQESMPRKGNSNPPSLGPGQGTNDAGQGERNEGSFWPRPPQYKYAKVSADGSGRHIYRSEGRPVKEGAKVLTGAEARRQTLSLDYDPKEKHARMQLQFTNHIGNELRSLRSYGGDDDVEDPINSEIKIKQRKEREARHAAAAAKVERKRMEKEHDALLKAGVRGTKPVFDGADTSAELLQHPQSAKEHVGGRTVEETSN